MASPEKTVAESFDVQEYEDIRARLQMPGQDRKTVQRELAIFCGQRIGQRLSLNSRAEVYMDRMTSQILPYDEPVELNDERVTIVDASEHGLIVARDEDNDRFPALEWFMADTFPISADAT